MSEVQCPRLYGFEKNPFCDSYYFWFEFNNLNRIHDLEGHKLFSLYIDLQDASTYAA